MPVAVIFSGLAAALGAALGLGSLIFPAWGSRVVRLRADADRPGGWAEFRASYGGGLLLLHAAVLLAIAMREQAGMASVIATGFAAGAAWLGMAIGRSVSMLLDHRRHQTRTGYNLLSVGFELVVGLALMAPWLGHIGG
ncbi:hypothetical protein [Maricaulis sp.]|jgi:hypothetical protein|uniref:hypothetical protein n=1 Tax=Maricaulis sp. TaxID=1486257 RepID=UPI00261AFC0D|nr:hypothetical protein [Maricaulis sp.]